MSEPDDAAKEGRESAHKNAIEKLQQAMDNENDKKKLAAMEKRMENLKGSHVALQDSEKQLARYLDAACRIFLKYTAEPVTRSDSARDKSFSLDRALAQMSWLAEQLNVHVIVKNINPETSKEFGAYRREQSQLGMLARRVQSTLSRYAAEKKKEEQSSGGDHDALRVENDRLK